MKFDIPMIVRPLSLAEYAPEMEAVIMVWVNPPRATIQKYFHAVTEIGNEIRGVTPASVERIEASGKIILEWAAEIWSQGEDDTRWEIEDVTSLQNGCMETDPALWGWLINQTVTMISDHRTASKKK
jgi:hypothetical protein